jgi:hypothetical protein
MNSALADSTAEDARPASVTARVEYLGAMPQRPRFHMGDPTLDRNIVEQVAVTIRDARPGRHELTLDQHGFMLMDHPTAVRNPCDADEIERVYRPELRSAVQAITGATHVIISARGVVRLAERSREFGAPGTTYPAKQVHSDYTLTSGPQMVRAHLDPDEAQARLSQRFIILSLWRAFSPPPQDVPLALCDAQSVAPEDCVLSDIVIGPPGRETVFEGSNFRFNPRHRWHYFRDMRRDELLLIKAFDSDGSRAWRVPHTSFIDPSAPPDSPPRESMDIRAIAFFDD